MSRQPLPSSMLGEITVQVTPECVNTLEQQLMREMVDGVDGNVYHTRATTLFDDVEHRPLQTPYRNEYM